MGFSYYPLPYETRARHIRLISLLPGSGDLRLQFKAEATRLDFNVIEPFEALSYVWGSKDSPVEVEVVRTHGTLESDNKPHSQFMPITQNLVTALQHLRYPDEARILWIDAICIDQSNLKEKSSQVAIMGDIYKHARQVIVWLGPAMNESGRALRVLGEIGSQVTVDWRDFLMSPSPDARDTTLGLKHVPFPSYFTADDASAVEALWARSWFERVWVRQEVALARSAIFQAGHDFLNRDLMQNAAFCFYHKDIDAPIFTGENDGETILEGVSSSSSPREPSPLSRISGGARVSLVQIMCQPPIRFFPSWLHYYLEGMHCGDSRDRVYSMLSLLRGLDNETLEFVPDYRAPVADCYRDLALRHIAAERSLNLLAGCSLSYKTVATAQGQPKRASRLPGLPSWVPDWSVDSDRHLSSSPITGGQPFLAFTEYLGSGVLRVSGLCCGTVSATSVVNAHSSALAMFHSLGTACRELDIPFAHTIDEEKTYPFTGESWATTLSRVLVRDRFYENFEPLDPAIISTQTMVRTITRILGLNLNSSLDDNWPGELDDPNSDLMLVAKSFRAKVAGRKLFKTSEGYLGLGPAYIQPGDKICLLLGSEFLIALRPQHSGIPVSDTILNQNAGVNNTNVSSTSQTCEHFLVVGECFVPGLMAGEPLLGSLPPQKRLIMRSVDGEDDYQVCLHDQQSGEATLRDPRIQTLEHRLSNALQEKGTEGAVVVEPCGKLHGEHGELRYEVKPESFNMLGIDMRHFDLV
ncbi:heterokaryon incompatibility protein-domain-containing protein [Xylaria venustula]|nr:heterokaryon incompatibility protein-domain-containing protein [Xylaria venustula]